MQELLLHFNYESQDEQEVVNIHTHTYTLKQEKHWKVKQYQKTDWF